MQTLVLRGDQEEMQRLSELAASHVAHVFQCVSDAGARPGPRTRRKFAKLREEAEAYRAKYLHASIRSFQWRIHGLGLHVRQQREQLEELAKSRDPADLAIVSAVYETVVDTSKELLTQRKSLLLHQEVHVCVCACAYVDVCVYVFAPLSMTMSLPMPFFLPVPLSSRLLFFLFFFSFFPFVFGFGSFAWHHLSPPPLLLFYRAPHARSSAKTGCAQQMQSATTFHCQRLCGQKPRQRTPAGRSAWQSGALRFEQPRRAAGAMWMLASNLSRRTSATQRLRFVLHPCTHACACTCVCFHSVSNLLLCYSATRHETKSLTTTTTTSFLPLIVFACNHTCPRFPASAQRKRMERAAVEQRALLLSANHRARASANVAQYRRQQRDGGDVGDGGGDDGGGNGDSTGVADAQKEAARRVQVGVGRAAART